VIDIAWRAQRRLYKRWQRLLGERRKRSMVVAVAVGRELAAFCWEIATLTGLKPASAHSCPQWARRRGNRETRASKGSALVLWAVTAWVAAPDVTDGEPATQWWS